MLAAAASVAALVLAAVVTAAVLLRHDITANPSSKAPDVAFLQGADYTAINAAGYATLSVGSSGTSATLDVSGIPGAALTSLGDVLKVQNTHASQAYTATLSRSAVPDGAIDGFTVKVYDSGDTLIESWDAAAAASGTSFNLPASTTYDLSIDIVLADGTAVGALGSFDIQLTLVPA